MNKIYSNLGIPPLSKEILEEIDKEGVFYSFTELYEKLVQNNKSLTYKNANKQFNKLAKLNCIYKNSNNLAKQFELSKFGRKLLRQLSRGGGEEVCCRTHNLLFKSKILRYPSCAFKGNTFKVNTSMKNWQKPQYITTLENGVHIQTSDTHITIRFKEIFAPDADAAIFEAFDEVIKTIQQLQKEYNGLYIGAPERVTDIVSQHHAIYNKKLSEITRKYYIEYKDGRIDVDSSKDYPEIEFVSPIHAQGDFQEFIAFIEAVVSGEFKWRDMIDNAN